MPFAFVYVHSKNKKSYQTVQTNCIRKFDIDKYVCVEKSERAKIPYVLSFPDGERATCQVLAVAGKIFIMITSNTTVIICHDLKNVN